MSSNLVDSVTQILSSNLLERFSSSLGLQKTQVENATRAGVPALLAALSSFASKFGGASALQEAVSRQPSGLLAKITNAVGGSGQSTLINSSNSDLTSLLGSTTTSAVSNAIAKYSGLGSGESQSIMGMLSSAVMGVLGQQQRKNNLDANGLSELLSSQSDNIARALPQGFTKYLSGTGILEGLAPSEDSRVVSGARTYSGTPAYAVPSTPKSTSMPWAWLLPILALGLAIGAWQLFSRRDERRAEVSPPVSTTTETKTATSSNMKDMPSSSGTSSGEAGVGPVQGPSLQALESLRGIKVGNVDFGLRSTSAVNALRDSLATITDEASARAALEPLKNSAAEFRSISGLADQLSPENRGSLASVISAVRPTLDQLCDKALQVPGAGAILKPTIDDIRTKLDNLASRAS